jgi:hypothetical protein
VREVNTPYGMQATVGEEPCVRLLFWVGFGMLGFSVLGWVI